MLLRGQMTKLRDVKFNRLITCDVMAAMLVVRNDKIFLLWGLTSIFILTMRANFLLFWHQHDGNVINV